MYRLIVAGSRSFDDYPLLEKTLISVLKGKRPSEVEIVSGTARGADRLGEQFAREKQCGLRQFPADWKLYGRQAGPLRNRQMARYADGCVVFWDGMSRGTASMISLAKEEGLELTVVRYPVRG